MYLEVSWRNANDFAIIEKNDVLVCGGNQSLSFHYHMYGIDMGTLNVTIGDSTVFSLTGNQGNTWSEASIPLPSNEIFKVMHRS